MAKKLKNPISNPPQTVSYNSSDDDGAPIYTPPESESNGGASSSTYLPDPNQLSEVIQGPQDVKFAQDKDDNSEEESIRDVSAKGKKGRRSRAKKTVLADIAVDNVTDALQTLAVADTETDNVDQGPINAKSAKNRKEKERKKRRKARLAEEDAKKETDATIANCKSTYVIVNNAGYSGMKHFMDSHGLRPHDDRDIEMAKRMMKHMGEKAGDNPSNDQPGLMKEEDSEKKEETGGKKLSNYKWLKNSGWRDMKKFMMAHGYQWGDYSEYYEAKELVKRIEEDQASEKQAKQLHPQKKDNVQGVEKVEDSSVKLKTDKTNKENVVGLWDDYFGNESQLANWQRLCVDVGMEEIPTSITQCRKALGKVWVNIFDFLDAKAEGKPVKRYKSERVLARYTLTSGKIYPKKHAKQGGPARVLLAHVFRH